MVTKFSGVMWISMSHWKGIPRNWKITIRYLGQPLSCFMESYTDTDGKSCYQFVDSTPTSALNVSPWMHHGKLTTLWFLWHSSQGSTSVVCSLAHSHSVVFDLSSSNDQSAPQFFDSDTVPSANQAPSQLLQSVISSSSVQPPLLIHTISIPQ